MSKKLDVNRLIAEVKQRPALWDVRLAEYKDRAASALLWREIAENVGCDVEQCKRKWKNIRDAYRAEVRRTERRVQRLKLEGHDDPKVSDSKWVFFKPMSFMSESKRKRYSTPPALTPHELSSDSHEATYAADAASADAADAAEQLEMEDYCQIKMEHNTTDEEGDYGSKHDYMRKRNGAGAHRTSTSPTKTVGDDVGNNNNGTAAGTPDDDDEANEKLFKEFQTVATTQAARRLSGTLSFGGSLAVVDTSLSSPPPTPISMATATATATPPLSTALAAIANSDCVNAAPHTPKVAQHTSTNAVNATANHPNCKCSQRENQVHFLEDLEREEQQLMQSTRRDITRASSMNFFGDSDYNFLVSFLPQMKRLSELQNLQFRAKMSELMLHIMAQQKTAAATLATTTMTTTTSLPAFDCISAAPPAVTNLTRHCNATTSSYQPPQFLHHHHHQQQQQQPEQHQQYHHKHAGEHPQPQPQTQQHQTPEHEQQETHKAESTTTAAAIPLPPIPIKPQNQQQQQQPQ